MCGYSGIVPLEFLCGYSVVVVDLWDPSVVTLVHWLISVIYVFYCGVVVGWSLLLMCGYSGIVPLEFLCGYSVVVVDLWDPSVVTLVHWLISVIYVFYCGVVVGWSLLLMCGYSGIVPLEFLCGYSVVVVDLWDPSVVTLVHWLISVIYVFYCGVVVGWSLLLMCGYSGIVPLEFLCGYSVVVVDLWDPSVVTLVHWLISVIYVFYCGVVVGWSLLLMCGYSGIVPLEFLCGYSVVVVDLWDPSEVTLVHWLISVIYVFYCGVVVCWSLLLMCGYSGIVPLEFLCGYSVVVVDLWDPSVVTLVHWLISVIYVFYCGVVVGWSLLLMCGYSGIVPLEFLCGYSVVVVDLWDPSVVTLVHWLISVIYVFYCGVVVGWSLLLMCGYSGIVPLEFLCGYSVVVVDLWDPSEVTLVHWLISVIYVFYCGVVVGWSLLLMCGYSGIVPLEFLCGYSVVVVDLWDPSVVTLVHWLISVIYVFYCGVVVDWSLLLMCGYSGIVPLEFLCGYSVVVVDLWDPSVVTLVHWLISVIYVFYCGVVVGWSLLLMCGYSGIVPLEFLCGYSVVVVDLWDPSVVTLVHWLISVIYVFYCGVVVGWSLLLMCGYSGIVPSGIPVWLLCCSGWPLGS